MTIVVLGCKAVIAVLLVAAGGAKLADLAGFTGSVRLFAPRRASARLLRATALSISLGEIGAGAASLSSPQVRWLNLVAAGFCCGFAAVWVAGYAWHRDRPCRCFGALSRRSFNLAGIGRTMVLALGAAVATVPVRQSLVAVTPAGRLALLAGSAVIAVAAFSAAAAAGVAGAAGAAGVRGSARGRAA